MFYYLLFQLKNESRLLKRITVFVTLYTLQTKLRIAPVALVVTDVLRLLRSSWRAVMCYATG